jgi:rhodanese-related sulfurtransferase/glyoxylase-like metal-dependent hydrolase (beta-lactamase superfamily II)
MVIERFYLACLSHASYLIASNGQAAVIDPQRDVEIYLNFLDMSGYRLAYVIETHLHADFVSGHVELARRTGAEVIIGHRANAAFDHIGAHHGDTFQLGSVTLKILETPGHTPEGITIEARDASTPDEPIALFTGDTLFAGDVGRPDLLDSVGITKEELASALYDSLHEKILSYPDETRVYPAHGAGSSCGKALKSVEFSTIGAERFTNYALKPMSREEFVKVVTEGQPEAPMYFVNDARINRAGAPELAGVIGAARAMSLAEFVEAIEHGVTVLDTRSPEEFSQSFIPGSINISLDGQFASWVGTLLPLDRPVIVVAAAGKEEESALRCARIGLDHVLGYLEGGFEAWRSAKLGTDAFTRLEPAELRGLMSGADAPVVVDVRRDSERAAGHIPGSRFITLSRLGTSDDEIGPKDRTVVVHCAGGYRSSIAASILKKHGFARVYDLRGGIGAWEQSGFPVELDELEPV